MHLFKSHKQIKSNRKEIILFFLLLYCGLSKAQTPNFSCGFKFDTLAVKAGETFSNSFWISNHKKTPSVLVQYPNSDGKNKTLLKMPDTIKLNPGERKWFPLKYITNKETIAKNLQELTVSLKDIDDSNSEIKSSFIARLTQIQSLFIETDQPEIYLNQVTNQARVMVRLFNNGLIPLTFNIELTEIPDGLDFTGETTHIILAPGQQLFLPYIAKNKLNSRTPADFAVTIRAVDQSGVEMAIKRLRIMSVSSDRRLSLNQSPFYQYRPNTIALRYAQVGQSLGAYQLQGRGAYAFEDKSRFAYQLNAEYFNNPGQKGLNLSDSYLQYDNGSFGVTLGSLYESMDFNLNGQGLKVTAHLDKNKSINVYGVQNSNFLYTDFYKIKTGKTYAINYKEEVDSRTVKNLMLLYNGNLATGINTTLASGKVQLPLSGTQHINLETGLSTETSRIQSGMDKPGAAMGLSYHLNLKHRFNLNSYNYYSSAYYAGLRRGLLQSDNLISIGLGAVSSLNARINITQNSPEFLTQLNGNFKPLTNKYGNETYELGFGSRIGKLNINFAPYYQQQSMQVNDAGLGEKENWKSSAARLRFNANYSYFRHEFSIETDNGYIFRNTSKRPPAPFFSSRSNFNYRNQIFGLNALVQLNSYYLTDAVGIAENPKYLLYSFGPIFHFALLKRSLTFNGNAMYNYYGFNRTENYSFNGNLSWKLKDGWAVGADFYYGLNHRKDLQAYNPTLSPEQQAMPRIQDNNYRFESRQIRVSLEKSFGRDLMDHTAKLELTCFEDQNSNGSREKEEPVVSGILVKIEEVTAVTQAQGMVRFTAAKGKKYAVSIVNNNGWNMLYPEEILLAKNMKRDIALVKKERLSGSLSFITEKYKNTKPELAGIRVKAVSNNGLSFDAITNEKGDFNFYLPANNYTVYVDTEGMPFSVNNPKETVKVAKGYGAKPLKFICKDEQKQIEITKF